METSTAQAFLSLFLILSLTLHAVAGRNIPTKEPELQPEWLGHSDRSVLIPGFGRVMLPPKGSHSFNYDPITGLPKGNGVSTPGVGVAGPTGGARSYVPGGDDTFLPNPGVEVPNPVGGGIPTPSAP